MNKILTTMLYGPAALQKRSLERVDVEGAVTDINVAFANAIEELTGVADTSIASVYRATQLIADSVSSLHMEEVNQTTGEVMTPTPPILENPDPSETYHDTMNKLVYSLLYRGNAYFHPTTRTTAGEIVAGIVLDPDEVNVNWDRKRIYREYSWRDRELEPDKEILHIAINRMPGREKGVGPITAARLLSQAGKAEANFHRKLYEDDATPSMAIEVPTPLTSEEINDLTDKWESAHKNRKKVAVVSGGATLKPYTINPVDAEFLESRKFTVQEFARMFGLPGFFLSVESGSSLTYTTTESLFRLLITSTLRPTYLERIEQSFSRLLPNGTKARFNVSELLQPDVLTRYQAYELAIETGFLTVDEVRQREGWNV